MVIEKIIKYAALIKSSVHICNKAFKSSESEKTVNLLPYKDADFYLIKYVKLQAVKDILVCPHCYRAELDFVPPGIVCKKCKSTFRQNTLMYDFLNSEMRENASVKHTEKVSSHDYIQIQNELTTKHPYGLILDHGCGLKTHYLPNVVYFDIVDYETTDVRGIAERLPFRDNSFESVISIAVLEHVKNPFECAKEIVRVLKPGGTLYVDVPFLQTYHGYPDHYYNMTMNGLRNLFKDDIEISQCFPSHTPLKLFPWYIKTYLSGLSIEDQKEFLQMRIEDFLDEDRFMGKHFVPNLSPQAHEIIAYAHTLIGSKKEITRERP